MEQPLSGFLAVSDVDNTLLTAQLGIPARNLQAIQRFCSLGGKFTLATGRNIPSAMRYLKEFPIHAPMILLNGALIWDYRHKQVVDAHYVERDKAEKCMTELRQVFPELGVEIMAENLETYVVQANEYTEKHLREEQFTAVLADADKISGEWFKVLLTGPAQECLAAEKYCKRHFVHCTKLLFQRTQSCFFEILPADANKGAALRSLCAFLHLNPRYSVAFGDYDNDIQLLRKAGLGVAVANASPKTRRAADMLTATCQQGGVADVLNTLVDLKTGNGRL